MHDAESFNFKIVTMGQEDVDVRPKLSFRPVTLANLLSWIDATVKDERVAEEVKKAARTYPSQALGKFKKNIQTHVARAKKKLRQTPEPIKELTDAKEEKRDSGISVADALRHGGEEFN